MWIIYFLAQVAPKITADQVGIQKATSTDILANGLNAVYFGAGALAVIVIILAGYQFSTAVYDPAKITIAKNSLLYSVVGLIVIIFAFVITQFVMGRF